MKGNLHVRLWGAGATRLLPYPALTREPSGSGGKIVVRR